MMRHGQRPNELVVKKLSMLGCVALVLAHSVKDMQDKLRGYHAGMPQRVRPPLWLKLILALVACTLQTQIVRLM